MSTKGNSSISKDNRRIRRAFDATALQRICSLDVEEFEGYAPRVSLSSTKSWKGAVGWKRNNERCYFYKDNGSDILAVAHLDSVVYGNKGGPCTVARTSAGYLAVAGNLDDRIGAYLSLEMLPALGINVDVLLTVDEETGATTASDFVVPEGKHYNHLIEFDRGGRDVVLYNYETQEYKALVEATGAKVGRGSYSDICALESLGTAGFNWGVGYYDYHGPRSHAWLSDTFMMLGYYLRFHRENAGTFLEHVPYKYVPTYDYSSRWDNDESDWAWRPQPVRVNDSGKILSVPVRKLRSTDKMCAECNEVLVAGKFCMRCGANYDASASARDISDADRLEQWLEQSRMLNG